MMNNVLTWCRGGPRAKGFSGGLNPPVHWLASELRGPRAKGFGIGPKPPSGSVARTTEIPKRVNYPLNYTIS